MNKKITKRLTKEYFDKDIQKEVEEMTDDEMVSQIRGLETTRYWVAVTKYIQNRMMIAQGSLCVLDPVKSPAEIARAQGILTGLLDLHDMSTRIKDNDKQKKADAEGKGDSSGPGYMA